MLLYNIFNELEELNGIKLSDDIKKRITEWFDKRIMPYDMPDMPDIPTLPIEYKVLNKED